MPLIRSLLVKKRPLKLILVTDNFKSIKFGPRHTTYNKANSILAYFILRQQFYLKTNSLDYVNAGILF